MSGSMSSATFSACAVAHKQASSRASRNSVRALKRTETRVASKASIITEAVAQFETITQLQEVCGQQQGSSGSSSGSSSMGYYTLFLLERWTLDECSSMIDRLQRVLEEKEEGVRAAQQQLAAAQAEHDEVWTALAQAQVKWMMTEVERVKRDAEWVKEQQHRQQRMKDAHDLDLTLEQCIRDKDREAFEATMNFVLTLPDDKQAIAAAKRAMEEKRQELKDLRQQREDLVREIQELRKWKEEERKKKEEWQKGRKRREEERKQRQHKGWVRSLTTLLQAAGEPLPHTTSAEHLWTVVSQVVDDALATAWEAGLVPAAAGPPRLATITLSALQAIKKRVAEKKSSSRAAIRDEFFFMTPPSSITKPEKNPYLVYWPDNAQFFTDIWREPLAKQFELKADDITPQAVIAKIHEIPVLEVSSSRGPRPRGRQVTLGLRQGLPSPKLLTTGWANEAEMRPDIAQHLNGMALRLGAWVTFNSAVPIMKFKSGTRPKTDIVMVDGRTNTKAAVFELTLGEDADSLGQLAAYAHHAIVANVHRIAGEHVPLEKLPLLAGLAMFGLRVSPVQTTVVEFMVANAGGVVKMVANNIISIPTRNIGQVAMAISCFADFLHAKYDHAIKQNTEHGSDFALNVMKPHVLHFNPDSGKEAPKVLSSVANKGSGYVCKFIKTGHRAGDLRAEEIENMWKYVNGQRACRRIPTTNSTATNSNIRSSGNGTQMIAVPHLGSTRAHIHEQHVVQLCNSLFSLSAAGLVHADIHTGNVAVIGDEAALIDFELTCFDADVMKAAGYEPTGVALVTDLPERSARIRAAGDELVTCRIEDDWIAMFYVCSLRSALYERAPQRAHRATKDAMLAALKHLEQQQQQQQQGEKEGKKEEEEKVVLLGMSPPPPPLCEVLGRIKEVIEEIPLYD
ncbi:kinase subdomain-containing protein [Salpingoeca rosetta]|uniref:Kinase subdomain-containing protein n=1 Tax=Salpingoeca rosetta (strain ATCC 50818 / BSB-021) TaxID=946362 RepID=F2U977_SALR5|nr:kinase subdomain-containing protein [Salpingoeca rosetta]EGD73280.1 kinase subdomain-containing protein [Salpingoeca rosetta]|eukprot:XP_004994311.1 kinase subdomain-containing protein [Salpingoeca rosetta]